jgi:ribosomal protein L37E
MIWPILDKRLGAKFKIQHQYYYKEGKRRHDFHLVCKSTGRRYNVEIKFGLTCEYGGAQKAKDETAAKNGKYSTMVFHWKSAYMPTNEQLGSMMNKLMKVLANRNANTKITDAAYVHVFNPEKGI